MPSTPSLSAGDRKRMREFEAREDLRTLSGADEIRRTPKRLRAARLMARKELQSAQRTARSLGTKR